MPSRIASGWRSINSVLSVVIGGHFPLGGIPWPQIEKAREVLAGLAE